MFELYIRSALDMDAGCLARFRCRRGDDCAVIDADDSASVDARRRPLSSALKL